MAHTRQVSGVMREIYTGTQSAAGGNEVVDTRIRISAGQLSRVRGLLTITSQVGLPVVTAVGSVVAGLLVVTIANNVGGSSIVFTLDIELTHSVQQALDRTAAAYIQVAAGTVGLLAPETLAVAYGVGAAAGDQTLVLATADGDGVIIDGVTQVGAAGLYAFEVREGANYPTMAITRRGSDATGPVLEFNKARGAFGAPADLLANDYFGVINFVGRVNNVSNTYCVIEAMVLSVTGGPVITTALEFYATHESAMAHVWRMNATVSGAMLIGYGTQPIVQPNTTETGCLGQTDHIWDLAYVNTVFAYDNLSLGGASILGGADHTIVLPNSANMPVAQIDQVYVGAKDWTGSGGGGFAALAISSEEQVVVTGGVPTALIPIMFNAVPYYLLAINKAPA